MQLGLSILIVWYFEKSVVS